jgi:hypothetical protein
LIEVEFDPVNWLGMSTSVSRMAFRIQQLEVVDLLNQMILSNHEHGQKIQHSIFTAVDSLHLVVL